MIRNVDVGSAGTLTFLFTDLEGSTRLWEQFPDGMKGALERHDAILPAQYKLLAYHKGILLPVEQTPHAAKY